MENIIIARQNDLEEAFRKVLNESGITGIKQESQVQKIDIEKDDWITGYRGLAKFANCSLSSAVKLGKSSKFPVYNVGKKVFFRKTEVLKGIKS